MGLLKRNPDVYVKVHGYVQLNNIAQYLLLGHRAKVSLLVLKSNCTSMKHEINQNAQTIQHNVNTKLSDATKWLNCVFLSTRGTLSLEDTWSWRRLVVERCSPALFQNNWVRESDCPNLVDLCSWGVSLLQNTREKQSCRTTIQCSLKTQRWAGFWRSWENLGQPPGEVRIILACTLTDFPSSSPVALLGTSRLFVC